MVAAVSPQQMPRAVHGRLTRSYDGGPAGAGARARVAPGGATALGPGSSSPCRSGRVPARTYRRRRAVAAGLVVSAVLALSAGLGTLGGGPLPVPERPAPDRLTRVDGAVYVVQRGDTFWSIARRLDPSADPRPLVDRLVAAHGSPVLYVGERIPLPAS